MASKRRYAQVGLGGRHKMWRNAVAGTFSEHCELVGLCDNNPGRLQLSAGQVKEEFGGGVPTYAATDFDRMIQETLIREPTIS